MLFVNWACNFFFLDKCAKQMLHQLRKLEKKGGKAAATSSACSSGDPHHMVSLSSWIKTCLATRTSSGWIACKQTRLLSATTKAVSPAPAPASLQDSWVSAWQKDAAVNPSRPRWWYTCKVRSVMDRLWQLLNVLESVILSLLWGRHVCSDKQRPCAVSVSVRREMLTVHFKCRTLPFFPHSRTDKALCWTKNNPELFYFRQVILSIKC